MNLNAHEIINFNLTREGRASSKGVKDKRRKKEQKIFLQSSTALTLFFCAKLAHFLLWWYFLQTSFLLTRSSNSEHSLTSGSCVNPISYQHWGMDKCSSADGFWSKLCILCIWWIYRPLGFRVSEDLLVTSEKRSTYRLLQVVCVFPILCF